MQLLALLTSLALVCRLSSGFFGPVVVRKTSVIGTSRRIPPSLLTAGMSAGGDGDGAAVSPKRGRKSKANKVAELVAQGMDDSDAVAMVEAQSMGIPRKAKEGKGKGKDKDKGKGKGMGKGKGTSGSKLARDNMKLLDVGDEDGDGDDDGREVGQTGAKGISMGLDLDADLAALEEKLGILGDTDFSMDISSESRSAMEAISEDDLKEAIRSVQSGGGMEGMDEFLKMVESGEAAGDPPQRLQRPEGTEGTEGTEGVAPALDSVYITGKDVVAVVAVATDGVVVDAEAEVKAGADPIKKRRGRPPATVAATTAAAAATATTSNAGEHPVVIDGKVLDGDEFDLGVDPPPLEEFRRLMESLGPDNIFEDDSDDEGGASSWGGPSGGGDGRRLGELNEDELAALTAEVQKELADEDLPILRNLQERGWYPKVYAGGKPEREPANPAGPPGTFVDNTKNIGVIKSRDREEGGSGLSAKAQKMVEHYRLPADAASPWRVQIVSVVTNSSRNSTALSMVNKVYDVIKEGTGDDPRINYQTVCYSFADDEPFDELEDSVQMWLESYNTYHLIDGAACKEVFGCIMPHIVLGEKNLAAIVDKVKFALDEDSMGGSNLTPRLRRVRLRGGAAHMTTGFNTEHLDAEFSVVSVR